MRRFLFILLLALVATAAAQPNHVRVRIFSAATIEQMTVSFDLGAYRLYADDTLLDSTLTEGTAIDIKRQGKTVSVIVGNVDYGTHQLVRLEATDTACILCLNPRGTAPRSYEGNLEISAAKGKGLLIINDVEFETYLAGVAQSEIYGESSEIFRVQAIISRTWALRNINKHKADGYNFCDHVHCQAYHNRCVRPDIMLGTIASTGETIVDKDGNLIETPFHSNSGGETANSEDVWRTALPYLRAVPDTFSYRMRQSDWEKSFTEEQWLSYFAQTHRLNTSDWAVRRTLLTFQQPHRVKHLLQVPLTRIRVDLKLKSTFFSVDYDSVHHRVTLHGHGYGHGVGLSQEGAIRMIRLGIPYNKIIQHYYTGAKIHKDENTQFNYVQNYVKHIEQIIEEDKHKASQTRSKKDDWLGRLFRLRDREEREETYDPLLEDPDSEWKYEW